MNSVATPKWLAPALVSAVVAYIAVCFGLIARKHGKHPVKYGLLSVVSPVNLVLLGYWAFSDYEQNTQRRDQTPGTTPAP